MHLTGTPDYRRHAAIVMPATCSPTSQLSADTIFRWRAASATPRAYGVVENRGLGH